jgi:hypothetical protein
MAVMTPSTPAMARQAIIRNLVRVGIFAPP